MSRSGLASHASVVLSTERPAFCAVAFSLLSGRCSRGLLAVTNTLFSPRRFAGALLLSAYLAAGFPAYAAGQGYVVTKTGDGVQIATGTPPADQAARLALPLRFENVTVTGMPDELAERVRARASDRVQRTGQAADVFALAQEVENLHREAGFALARVYLPPQRVRNGGSLRIEMVDVRLEDLDLDGLPPMVAERVRHHLSPLLGRSLLRTDDLARAVGLLQIEFGVTFKVEPLEGSRPDRVRLQVRGRPKAGSAMSAASGSSAARSRTSCSRAT